MTYLLLAGGCMRRHFERKSLISGDGLVASFKVGGPWDVMRYNALMIGSWNKGGSLPYVIQTHTYVK